MPWTPLGPTMVMAPRNANYTRMARANESGGQCPVLGIAVNPNDETNIIVVVRRVGGTSAFLTSDDGHSWTAIADSLTQANPQVDIACAAFHPAIPGVIYLGARAGQTAFVSQDSGATWPVQSNPGGEVTQLIVDRASGNTWDTATLYAATDQGVAVSTDGGQTWTMAGAAIGEVTSLAVYMPLDGTRQFYAGVLGQGLFYADAPGGPWTNLFGSATGLPPQPPAGTNLTLLTDYAPRHPDRVYVMIATLDANLQNPANTQLYVSDAAPPAGTWHQVVGTQPQLDSAAEGLAFMVSPDSPDSGDVLFCSGIGNRYSPQRSTDGGQTWVSLNGSLMLHADTRSFAHHPPKPAYYPDTLLPSDTVPPARIYNGCDGGLGASRSFSNPAFSFDTFSPMAGSAESQFNSGDTYDDTLGLIENLNHGLAAVAGHQFASNPDPLDGGPMSLIGYITALDTGGGRRVGSLAMVNPTGDTGMVYAAPSGGGVRVWENIFIGYWPTWNLNTFPDGGSSVPVTTPAAPSCGPTSNMLPASPGDLYAGIIAFEQVTTLAQQVTAGAQATLTIFPTVMTPDFVLGARVSLGAPVSSTFYEPITSVGANQFQVMIQGSSTYPVGTPIFVVRCWVGLVTGAAAAPISQAFIPQTSRIYRLAQSGDSLLGASADQNLWQCASASTANASTIWTQVGGVPGGLSSAGIDTYGLESGEFENGLAYQGSDSAPSICSLAADASGVFYVMLSSPAPGIVGIQSVNTPLWSVQNGAWTAENCAMPPTAAIPPNVATGKMVAHPTQAGRLYVTRNARVFQLDNTGASWNWTDLSGNLPGQEIHDLWIGNVAPAGAPRLLVLRALTAVRGIWEMELDSEPAGATQLYFRDHLFDPGWLGNSVDGVVSPIDGTTNWHWHSDDILVDTPMRDSSANLYYQNDPEAPTPTAGDFDWFVDRSQAAAADQTARVWVRVNSRSTTPLGTAANPINVWAIYAPYSAGLPSLPTSLWSLFDQATGVINAPPAGTLIPNADNSLSQWTSMGSLPLTGVHAEAPGIAGPFLMPTGAQGDHQCIAAFIHGQGALLNTSGLDLVVDDVARISSQIAQRNVLTAAPLPPGPQMRRRPAPGISIYINFNNPRARTAVTDLQFELSGLPASATFAFRLSTNAKPKAITGAHPWTKKDGARIPVLAIKQPRSRKSKPAPSPRLPLRSQAHVARGGGAVRVTGVSLKAGDRAAAQLVLRFEGELKPGATHRVDILQKVKGKVVGGATIVVPVASKPSVANPGEWEREAEISGMIQARGT